MEFEVLSRANLDIAIKIQHDIFPLENGSEDLKETINGGLPNLNFCKNIG